MDYIEYRTLKLKGFEMIMLMVLSGTISAFGLWMIFTFMNIWITLIFILPAMFLPFFIFIVKRSKVRIGKDYIEVSSLFGTKKIEFKEVNKFGVFFAGRYTWPKVTSQRKIDDSDDEDLLGHQIYLTTNTEFDLDSFRPARHVRFPYRRDLYYKIKEILESRPDKTPSPQQNVSAMVP